MPLDQKDLPTNCGEAFCYIAKKTEMEKKDMKKRMTALLLAGLLGAGMCSGCGSQSTDAEQTGAEAEETAASDTETADTEAADAEAEDAEATDEQEAAGSEEQAAGSEAAETAQTENGAEETAAPLEDGVYEAEFSTDSSMFHVNEACDGKGTLTVENGEMTIHISLVSMRIVNLYPGTAADAEADEAGWLQPTTDEVTYSDGMTEEVYGFDVPVPALEEEFDLALLGEKGTWYDHKVSVSNPVAVDETE